MLAIALRIFIFLVLVVFAWPVYVLLRKLATWVLRYDNASETPDQTTTDTLDNSEFFKCTPHEPISSYALATLAHEVACRTYPGLAELRGIRGIVVTEHPETYLVLYRPDTPAAARSAEFDSKKFTLEGHEFTIKFQKAA